MIVQKISKKIYKYKKFIIKNDKLYIVHTPNIINRVGKTHLIFIIFTKNITLFFVKKSNISLLASDYKKTYKYPFILILLKK